MAMAHGPLIEPQAFKKVLAQQVQNRLRTACLPEVLGRYVDHVDAVGAEVLFLRSESGGLLCMPLGVYIVADFRMQARACNDGRECDCAVSRSGVADWGA